MGKQGEFWHSAWRALMVFIVFAGTTLTMGQPAWADVTIGSAIFGLVHWAASQYKM